MGKEAGIELCIPVLVQFSASLNVIYVFSLLITFTHRFEASDLVYLFEVQTVLPQNWRFIREGQRSFLALPHDGDYLGNVKRHALAWWNLQRHAALHSGPDVLRSHDGDRLENVTRHVLALWNLHTQKLLCCTLGTSCASPAWWRRPRICYAARTRLAKFANMLRCGRDQLCLACIMETA